MTRRLSPDARRHVTSAAQEARRRGDRRIGTDHLLMGLLEDPNAEAARILGTDLGSARAASSELDRAALAAVGIDVDPWDPEPPGRSRSHPPFTSGARDVLHRSLLEAQSERARRIEDRHLLLALVARDRPDPAADLLAALGIDPIVVRDRLLGPAA